MKNIIVWHETLLQSIVADAVTVGSLIGAVAVGKWIGSDALQWLAGIMVILTVISFKPKYRQTFTSVDEAKAYLEKLR